MVTSRGSKKRGSLCSLLEALAGRSSTGVVVLSFMSWRSGVDSGLGVLAAAEAEVWQMDIGIGHCRPLS